MVKLFVILDGKANFVINLCVQMIVRENPMEYAMKENAIVNPVIPGIFAKLELVLNNAIIMVFV
jgi:hypothetical protein